MLDKGQLPPKISKAGLSPDLRKLVDSAKKLYQDKLGGFVLDHNPPAFIVAAPGRVNLIGEHTDYTGGYVLPLAIDRHTVVYGTGHVHTGKGTVPTSVKLRIVSDHAEDDVVEERKLTGEPVPPDESEPRTWVNYVFGVVAQFLEDLPHEGCIVDLAMAISSDVPVGAGLSSSAALEVATATFVECFMHEFAYTSLPESEQEGDKSVPRALRCQKAENEWALSPCGIMDQICSSCAQEGSLMLIDCRSLEITHVEMKKDPVEQPQILVVNSKVEHEIADSEYGKRRGECNEALEAMQQVPLYHVLSLRDATLQDCETAKDKMDEVAFKRAKHVVTENQRTKECKTALKLGLWSRVGELMNASHKSLAEVFEVSCEEIDFLVDIAQKHAGVFGARITGGGFGGCMVALVKKEDLEDLKEQLQSAYKEKYGKDCDCFVIRPSGGAKVLAIDVECKKSG